MVQPESFPVCRGCGVLAPARQAACRRCGTALGDQVAWVPFRSDGYLSVAIEMEFQCRACGHFAPANFLDLDGSLGCAHCGIEQAFAPERFRDLLAAAHDVGDLAGPPREGHPANRTEPVGRDNPYAAIGTTAAGHSASLPRRDELDLKVRLELTRGRRLCHGCQMPVELYPDGQGKVTTVCSYCQERAEYALPAGAAAIYPPLLGVVADEHRSDWRHSETVASDGAGPMAIQCPSCHAPLDVSPNTSFARCQYCSTRSVIPARAWARAKGAAPTPQLWFALFHGPSERRKRLAMEAAMERASWERASASRQRTAAHAAGPGAYAPQPKKRGPWLAIGLGLVLAVGVTALVYFQAVEADGSSAPRQAGKSRRSSKRASKPKGPPPRSAFGELSYCSCLTEIDGQAGLENVTLANRIQYDDGGNLRLEIYLDVEGRKPLYLPLGPKTAPPARPEKTAIAIGMACEKEVVALLSGHYATGWSAKTGKKLWSKKIAGSYDHPKPPAQKPGQFSTWCAQLQPQQGKATLDLAGGKRLQVRIADGQLTVR